MKGREVFAYGLAAGFLSGWLVSWIARPTYDHWAFDRYAQRMCADGKITTITDHQIMCGGRP